jgi:hypothetical protein
MAIDFTKPIIGKTSRSEIKVLFHDRISVFYEYANKGTRYFDTLNIFEQEFENVPEEPMKFKAYIGLKRLQGMDRVESYLNKKILEENGYEQIQEVEFISGEGLQ